MDQGASIAGNGNTIVQIVGDGNSVSVRHAHLTLTRYVARRVVRQDLDRLSPYTRSTPLIGRDTELANLQAFLNDQRPMLARTLIGGGGSGKTRLALELCEQASIAGWETGFANRTELRRFFAQQNLSTWGWRQPTLIVIDYAAEQAQLLSQWLDELTDRAAPPSQPLRLLLLERSASIDTGWWATVFTAGGWGATSKRALHDPPEPVTIQPLAQAEDRLALLRAMLEQASPDTPLSVPINDPVFRDKLMQLTWGGDPLFLMMAALAMVRIGHAKALTLGRTDLADALAVREADRLQQLAKSSSLDPALVQHLASCVTLAQGMNREDFQRFAASEKDSIHRPGGGDAAALADVLQQALPSPNGIAPVLPDLIGEALIVRTMGQDAQASAVLRCHTAFRRPVTESVIRCAQDFAEQSPAPLKWLEAIVDAVGNDDAALSAMYASLPTESVALRDLNLKVAQRLHALRTANEDTPPQARASALNSLAIAMSMAGQREPALLAAQEAVVIRRELAALRPDAFRPDLARSLNNLGNTLSELGQHEPALLAAQEAVDIRRELAALRPDVFRPDLAMSLNSLANRLSKLGQREPALLAAQEAADLYGELAAQRPEMFRRFLAGSLSNLANRLSKLGQREPALLAAQEAADLHRELAALRPDVFRPNLAASLNNLANMLSDLGQREPALLAAQEAVDIRRDLAALRPDVFRPDLAASLNNLANRLSKLGQREPALLASQEAVGIRRELAVLRPDVFRPDLASSLNNLAISHSELGHREPALLAAQEAADLYRELAALRPDVFRPDLAMSLNNMANSLSDLGQREPALLAAQEAAEQYRELTAQRPDVFRPNLAMSLKNLAGLLGNLGQREPALLAAQEAADIYRELAAQRPDAFRPVLAKSLMVLALRTRDISSAVDALPFAREAVVTLQFELLRHPAAYLRLMRQMLGDYVRLCQSAGQEPDLDLLGTLSPCFTTRE